MSIDLLDIKVLREFHKLKEDEEITTWKLMRMLFPKGGHNEVETVKYRLNKLEGLGLFIISKNSPKSYIMLKENVIFDKFKFPRRKEKSLSVWLNINNRWEVREILKIIL